jgi:hypothetical protein
VLVFASAAVAAAPSLGPVAPAYAAVAEANPGANAPIPFRLFPPSSPWNTDVSALPVHALSSTYLRSIGLDTPVHADFGTTWDGGPNGIPYVLVTASQPKLPVTFYYADESDPGPYPIPPDAPVEWGSDHHVLALDVDNRILYELYDATYNAAAGRWDAGSGAVWHLDSNATRPAGWTSADAAGLPMLPGLVRYDEVKSGEITHALRFTVEESQRAYVFPATHYASELTDPALPPMGLRLRLKASYDVSGFPADVQVILRGLKKYGMIVADNGGPLYISGSPDPRWDDDVLHAISQVKGSDFEVVDTAATAPPSTPVVSAGRGGSVRAGSTLVRAGSFTDAYGARWTATVDYDDHRGRRPLALTADKRFTLRVPCGPRGIRHVVVRVRNDQGRTGIATFTLLVKR